MYIAKAYIPISVANNNGMGGVMQSPNNDNHTHNNCHISNNISVASYQ